MFTVSSKDFRNALSISLSQMFYHEFITTGILSNLITLNLNVKTALMLQLLQKYLELLNYH